MFFLTFEENGKDSIGVLTASGTHIFALAACEQYYFGNQQLPTTMLDLINQWDQVLGRLQAVSQKAQEDSRCPHKIALDSVSLRAPIPRPAKNIFCIGKNYAEHALEHTATSDPNNIIPKHPVIFTKAPTTVIGPNDVIQSHRHITNAVDYEVELAVVIGKKAKGVARETALDYVFGYTIFNDVTARDLQKQHLQWFRGKSMDTFGPMGPYLAHKSMIPNPGSLSIMSKINGEVRQNANTKDFIFDIPTLIATISAGITLEPGDIIATGTPAGVGVGFNPPKFLKPGDIVECSIEGLGVLRNTIE